MSIDVLPSFTPPVRVFTAAPAAGLRVPVAVGVPVTDAGGVTVQTYRVGLSRPVRLVISRVLRALTH